MNIKRFLVKTNIKANVKAVFKILVNNIIFYFLQS